MKRIWLAVGTGTLVVVVAVALLMSGIVEAPSQRSNQTNPGGTVPFEKIEKEVAQKEESTVDFDGRELTVYAGTKPTGGHSMEIGKIEETEDKLVVYVKEYEPGDGCIVTQAITYPQATVRLSKQINKPVEVVTERVIRDCQ